MLVDYTPPMFVNFDMSTGDIDSVGPNKSDTLNSLEVTYGAVERILTFKDKKSDYKVVFNTLNKEFELKHQSEVQTVYQGFLKVEENITEPDVELLYSPKHKKIELIVSDKVKEVLETTNINSEVFFSITEKDNPHVLYALLHADLRKQNTFVYTYNENFSIYTKRQFAKYNYRKIG